MVVGKIRSAEQDNGVKCGDRAEQVNRTVGRSHKVEQQSAPARLIVTAGWNKLLGRSKVIGTF